MNKKINECNNRELIFVGGNPRSGTTLVQNLLGSHPDILGLPEFFLTQHIAEMREIFHYWIKHKMIDKICSYEDVDLKLKKFIESFLCSVDKERRYKYVSEKTPQNVYVFNDLLDLFPEGKFVHVIRDPRAVANSFFTIGKKSKRQAKKSPLYTRSIREAICYIKKGYEAGMAAEKKGGSRVYTIKYEDVVNDSVTETKKLCEYLGVEWVSSMVTPANNNLLNESTMTSEHNSAWYDKNMFKRNPEKKDADKWRHELNNEQQVRLANAFRGYKYLEGFGYDFSLDYMPRLGRIQGHIRSELRRRVGDMRLAIKKRI